MGKSGSGLTDPSTVGAGGGGSAWAQYRAGEHGAYTPADPMGETTGQSTYASSMSPGATSGPTNASVAGGGGWGDLFNLSDEDRAALMRSLAHGGSGGQSGYSQPPAMPGMSFDPVQVKVNPLGFALTPHQRRLLGAGMSEDKARQFLTGQIASGNTAYGPYTLDQLMAARQLSGK